MIQVGTFIAPCFKNVKNVLNEQSVYLKNKKPSLHHWIYNKRK